MKKRLLQALAIVAVTALLSACTPYGGLNISAPFKVGPVYVNPSIGVGGSL